MVIKLLTVTHQGPLKSGMVSVILELPTCGGSVCVSTSNPSLLPILSNCLPAHYSFTLTPIILDKHSHPPSSCTTTYLLSCSPFLLCPLSNPLLSPLFPTYIPPPSPFLTSPLPPLLPSPPPPPPPPSSPCT